ncbi:MAG TPA: ABC transporter permease [Thermoanaerobaculia bacterium]|nr:ABC transporter permease [Thermoanaerobaculia bacterium]
MKMMLPTLRLGFRRLWKHPAHSGVAVLTLALGIGLTTAMYAIVEGTFLRGLPFAGADRIFRVERVAANGEPGAGFTASDFRALRDGQASCDAFAAWIGFRLNLGAPGAPAEAVNAGYATAGLLRLTGVQPALGRTFRSEDELPGAPRIVLLSDDLWHQRFGGDPRVVGTTVRISGEPATVIGVMPPHFRFPLNQYLLQPLRLDQAEREGYPLQLVARLREGVSPRQADAELRALGSHLPPPPGVAAGFHVRIVPFVEAYVDQELRSRQWLMLGAILGVLLIACVNVANLLLARAVERTPEMAVRAALGAGRLRVAADLLAESLVLAGCGGIAGLGVAQGAIALYRRLMGNDIVSFWVDIRLDGRAVLFALGLTLLAALAAGLLPALHAARSDPGEILRDQSRGSTGRSLGRFSRLLAVAEIALSCGLLIPTGLTVRSLVQLARLELSFPADRVLTAGVSFDGPAYASEEARRRYFAELGRRLSGLPGVRAVAFASVMPLERLVGPATPIVLEAHPGAEGPAARWAAVSPPYFTVFGLRLLAGRLFTAEDGAGSPPAALVSRGFAERFFPGRSPLGQRFRTAGKDHPWHTIVGMVSDLSLGGLDGDPSQPAMYFPWDQKPVWGGALAVRVDGAPGASMAALRRQAVAVDPNVPLANLATLEEVLRAVAEPYTRAGALFGLFGGIALFLAALGLYGVMAFAVERRTREIGVRMALGARAADIRRLVLREGLFQLAIGVGLGLALALGLSRLLAASLFQVRPWDPAVFVLAPAVLVLAGLLACQLPARRAARVDPVESLRAE